MMQSSKDDRRKKSRTKVNKVYVEILLTFPKNARLHKEVLDLGETGLSFKMFENEGYLAPGTVIRKLKLHNGSDRTKTYSGIIKTARPFHNDGELCYRVGLEFLDSNQNIDEKSSIPFPIRPKRHSIKSEFEGNSIAALASFASFGNEHFSGKVLDFSKYGAAIELLHENHVLRLSNKIRDFNITIGDEKIYSGEATIVRIDRIDELTLLGVSFNDAVLDMSKYYSLERKHDFSSIIDDALTHARNVELEISNEYKINISDLKYFLETLKNVFSLEENNIKKKLATDNNGDVKRAYEIVLKNIMPQCSEIMSSKMKQIEQCTKDIDDSKQELYKAYYRHHLHPLLMHSDFVRRMYQKPLGYPGDYRIIGFFYKDDLLGKDMFSMFLDKYCYDQMASKAIANRNKYLTDMIYEHIKRAKSLGKKTISITNVGCGPAKEIQDLISQNGILDDCIFTFIDLDAKALLYAQEKILDSKTSHSSNFKAIFCQMDVRELLKSQKSILEKQDLIYSTGLIDYFGHDSAKTIIKNIYNNLSPEGLVIIGNMDPSNETRFFMEYAAEWYLDYKSKDDMELLASDLIPSPEVHIESEETSACNFLLLRKN